MITSVVFDLDDTLYEEVDYCRSGFGAVAQFVAGLAQMPPAEAIFDSLWRQFTTGNCTKTFDAALEELGVGCDEQLIGQLIEVYRNHVPQIALPRDTREVLHQLKETYTLALLTDGFLPAQKLKVQALGLGQYFKCIIYTEELGRRFWKPSPAGFERVMEALGIEGREAAYVADNEEKDFIAPNKLGFLTVQIMRPARLHRQSCDVDGARARRTIRKMTELAAVLKDS